MLSRIEMHLQYGEWDQADELVQNLEHSSDIDDIDRIKLELYQTHVQVENKEFKSVRPNINSLINQVADLPKSLQLRILHVASKFSSFTGEHRMAKIYVEKFIEIYDNSSVVLTNKLEPLYADIKNIKGLLMVNNHEPMQALKIFEEVTQLQRQLGRPLHHAIASFNAGKTALKMDQPKRSEVFLQESYRIFKELDNISGQYKVVQSFIECYKLIGDKENRLSFETIGRDLQHKLDIKELKDKHKRQVREKTQEIKELRSRLVSLQSQIHNQDTVQNQLEEELEYLRTKSRDFEGVKEVYSDLKENISQLEATIDKQQQKIEEQNTTIKAQRKEISDLKTQLSRRQESIIQSRTQPDDAELKNLLASSKLVDNIFYKLKEIETAKLRILAMQLRVSQDRCKDAIRQLADIDVIHVDLEKDNPQIKLNSQYIN